MPGMKTIIQPLYSNTKPITCAVVGTGYLGRFHAQKLHSLPQATLVGVCDVNLDIAKKVAEELQVPAFTNHHDLMDKVEAVCIAASTSQHYTLAKDFLLNDKHVLLEKPITETIEQAQELVEIAKTRGVKFQIGHLERFNSARIALDEHLTHPLFIESQRVAPFNPRGTDVNVVLDLMIHDIDLLQTFVNSPIVDIDAHGTPVLSPHIDIANTHIRFENGCAANLTASRISFKTERKARIFQPNSYISIDYQNKQLAVFEKGPGEMFPGIPEILRHESIFEPKDALFEEIKAFLSCIIEDTQPLVTGNDGLHALKVATTITELITGQLSSVRPTLSLPS
jgi:predicted dehydrogenase